MAAKIESFPKPKGKILDVLKGEISEPIKTKSFKAGQESKIVDTRIVKKGSGMIGLENAEDNKEWSGIFEHVIRTSRLASFLAKKLKEKGIDIDPSIVLNTVLVSHSGRRQWDESRWYPDIVDNSKNKKTKSDTDISLELLNKAGISSTIIENVKSHDSKYGIEKLKDNWIAKIALYADYRTSQHIMSLQERFNNFKKRAIPAS